MFIHDSLFSAISEPIGKHCAELGVLFRCMEISYDGLDRISPEVRDVLLGRDFGIVLFGVVHNIWHAPERKYAKYELRKRMASLVSPPHDSLSGFTNADLTHMAAKIGSLSKLFRAGSVARVTSPGGSDFQTVIGTVFAEDGKYDLPAKGGDFPAGELGFGPETGSVQGTIVYDIKVQHIGLLRSPLRLTVEKDRVVAVTGEQRDGFLDLCTRRGDVLYYISEVSLGMNPKVGITADPKFIPEEKTYGTLHCGHGGNASYGSRTGAHIDGVMDSPSMWIDGELIMSDGKLIEPAFEVLNLVDIKHF